MNEVNKLHWSSASILVRKEKRYPAQLAVAGKLPTGQVGGALVFFQDYVRSFWISREVELAAYGGVSSSWSHTNVNRRMQRGKWTDDLDLTDIQCCLPWCRALWVCSVTMAPSSQPEPGLWAAPWQPEKPEGQKFVLKMKKKQSTSALPPNVSPLTSPGFSLIILIIADTAPSSWTKSRLGAFGSGTSPSPSYPWKCPALIVFPKRDLTAPLNTGICHIKRKIRTQTKTDWSADGLVPQPVWWIMEDHVGWVRKHDAIEGRAQSICNDDVLYFFVTVKKQQQNQ